MVEASSSLTRLLVTKDVFAQGLNPLQSFWFIIEATQSVATQSGEPVESFIYIIALFVGFFGANKWLANRSSACSLNLFLYLPVLRTALSLLQYSVPKIIKGVLVGLLTGMLLSNQKSMKIYHAMKARFWGFKLTDLSMLGVYLPVPIVEMLMIKPNQKLLNTITTVYCAFFTTVLLFQLQLRSIGDYAQEIDLITEELNIEKENSVDSEAASKSGHLSESEQAEDMKDGWRAAGICVLEILCSSVIPLIVFLRWTFL